MAIQSVENKKNKNNREMIGNIEYFFIHILIDILLNVSHKVIMNYAVHFIK